MIEWRKMVVGLLALAAGTAVAQQAVKLPPTLTPQKEASAPLVPVTPPTGARELSQADVDSWLDGFMPFALARGDIAGAVVVVVKDGQVLSMGEHTGATPGRFVRGPGWTGAPDGGACRRVSGTK